MEQSDCVVSRPTSLTNLAKLTVRPDLPNIQKGFVRLWRAKTFDLVDVDLRRTITDSSHFHPSEMLEDGLDPPPDMRRRLAYLLQPPTDLLIKASGPMQWPFPFFNYQTKGIVTLIDADSILLGDEMGLGKTIQTIASLRILVHQRKIERALIVTPASIVEQWMSALRLWAPELRCVAVVGSASEREWRWNAKVHVTVVPYETLRADESRAQEVKWDVVVLDEAQKIKNAETGMSHVCKKLKRVRSWAVTGTPLENRLEDLSSILGFVLKRPRPLNSAIDAAALLSDVQLRRRRADVLSDLPPKIVTAVPVQLTGRQRAAYERARTEGIVKLRQMPEIKVTHILALLTRLKQICNFEPETGESSKMDDLKERVAEIASSGNKTLIFSQFTDLNAGVGRIAEQLDAYKPLILTGAQTGDARQTILRRFDEDDSRKLLILSLKAGGVGLNLQRASYVIHFDRWWNPATETQAEDRAHRIGQKSSVSVYRYIVQNSIEQRIDELIEEKRELFDAVVERAVDHRQSPITKADLLNVLAADL